MYKLKLFIILCCVVALGAQVFAAEAQLPIYQSDMQGNSTDYNRVGGLCLSVQSVGGSGLPTLLMQDAVHWGGNYANVAGPFPFMFGTMRTTTSGTLQSQNTNSVTNTLRYGSGGSSDLYITLSRLSPAMILDSSNSSISMFVPESTSVKGEIETVHTHIGGHANNYSCGWYNGMLYTAGGVLKPLRWATQTAAGTVLKGVLGTQTQQAIPMPGVIRATSQAGTPSSPPVTDLDTKWLLLWYGSDSSFAYSGTQAIHWQSTYPNLLDQKRIPDWPLPESCYQADVPFLVIFQNEPSSVNYNYDNGISFNFSGASGKIAVMPLYGHKPLKAEDTEQWLNTVPSEVVNHCNAWAARLAQIPTDVSTNVSRNETNDTVTHTESFTFTQVRSGGSQESPVRPILALAQNQGLSELSFSSTPQDSGVPTRYGPVMTLSGSSYTWTVTGLETAILNTPPLGSSNSQSAPLEVELEAEVDKVLAAGHLQPFMYNGKGSTIGYWRDPADLLYYLAEIYPVVPSRQSQIANYMQSERTNYPPETYQLFRTDQGASRVAWDTSHWDSTSTTAGGSYYDYDSRMFRSGPQSEFWEDPIQSLFRAYGLARYYETCGGDPVADGILTYCSNKLPESLSGIQWDTMGWFWGKHCVVRSWFRRYYASWTAWPVNRDLAGLIGWVKLADMSGQNMPSDAWGQLARFASLRYAMARYARYLASSGIAHLPENTWVQEKLQQFSDFTQPENYVFQVRDLNQYRVDLGVGMANCGARKGNSVFAFRDMVPELGRILKGWGADADTARYLDRYAIRKADWYNAWSGSLDAMEYRFVYADEPYTLFMAHTWIAGTMPESLVKWIDIPWTAKGDFFYMHKLAETIKAYRAGTGPDTMPPSPDPATWAVAPHATGSTSISMTATTAYDPSGVEYYFDCTAGGGHGSGWQSGQTYQDTGLTPATQYTYRVMSRDKSANQNETAWSTALAATTESSDTTAPTPDPLTWASVPAAASSTSITMTATTASDPSGVEYYFDCTAGGGNDSGWQDGVSYTDTGLSPDTQYSYRVQARDKSANQNAGGWSTAESATTLPAGTPITVDNYSFELPGTTKQTNFDNVPGWNSDDATDTGVESPAWGVADGGWTAYCKGQESFYQTVSHTIGAGETYTLKFMACDSYQGGDITATLYYGAGRTQLASTTITSPAYRVFNEYTLEFTAQVGQPYIGQSLGIEFSNPSAATAYMEVDYVRLEYSGGAPPDTTPPTPDPLAWATVPYSTGTTSIAMVSATASDPSGVEYYFECTAGGGNDSGWQDSTTYEDIGLSPSTQYTYRVQARDKSANQNAGGWSTSESATTDSPPDITPPTPDPLTWASVPAATGSSSIAMTATTASDPSGVEYFFECTAGGGNDSGWQSSPSYTDTGLIPETQYTYRVKARDLSPNQNETGWSTAESATTQPAGATPLLTHWPVDDGSGTVASDIANGHDANLVSTPVWTTGLMNGALQFDGTDDYLDAGGGTYYNGPSTWADLTDSITVSVWVKTSVYSTSDNIISKGSEQWYMTAEPAFRVYIAGGGSPTVYGTTAINDNEWHHIAGVYNGSRLSIFVDGDEEGYTDISGTMSVFQHAPLWIGSNYNWPARCYEGIMDDVRIYDGALSPQDVNDLYQQGMGGGPDTTSPTPDPLTWATAPYATGTTSISMTATTASDPSGVEYYFNCTDGGGNDSAWQDSTTYEDTGLSPSTQYTYRVQARDKSANQNTGGWSTEQSATTDTPPDTTAPTPDPLTWATVPYATGTTSISMTAITASDPSGVEYYFECTAGGGVDSGWQDSTTYEDTGLSPSTQYTYRVQARDKSANQNTGGWSTEQSATTDTPPDTTAPTPDPLTWATAPYATGTTSISMTATTASDPSGVEYYFNCTAGGGHDSSWQDSTTYEDTGLSPSTQYTYRAQARDKSANQNTGGWSTEQAATTDTPPDTTAPTPDPLTWATAPYATGTTSISMTATTASDPSGVEYYFDCTAGGGDDSGWQDSATYEGSGLNPSTQYTYRVQARDKSANQNTGGWSTEQSATTDGIQPGPIAVVNHSFELPGTVKQMNFDNVPGWSSDNATDSGVESPAWGVSDGNWTGYAQGQESFYQELSHPIQTNGAYTLTFDGCDSYNGGQVHAMFYYDSGPGRTVLAETTLSMAYRVYNEYQLQFNVQTGQPYIGENLGVEFENASAAGSWMDIDNVRVVYAEQADTDPPTPDPLTWATVPYSTGTTSISMSATTASDPSGVEYYFDCTAGGGHDSGWQDSTTYEDTSLSPSTQYTYRVQARDKSINQNAGGWSTTQSATTDAEGALPWSDDFESGNLNNWTVSGSASASTQADYTGTYGAKLPGTGWIEKAVSTEGYTSIHVKYARTTKSMDSGEYLYIEWYDGSDWNQLEATQSESWAFQDMTCGSGANNNANFKVRFRTNADKTNEYSAVDNVEITGTAQ